MTPAVVVKLGGSHAASFLLRPWLAAVAGVAGVVVVPGGGPFADAVRAAQPKMGFGDRAAHDMGLLAMAQYGLALAGIEPRLVPADTLEALRDAIGIGRVAVWLPWPMLRDAPDIPAAWDVTSDSLALWLAAALGTPRVLLVKRRPPPAVADAKRIAREGLVDAAFPAFLLRFRGDVWIAGPDDLPISPIDPRAPPGFRVVPTFPRP